ncbi:response regulator transcription factor [Streptomyces sp. Ag109_G2-15]|uniref:response regulator n=1 Tax=Streptomyces sp. Ag109_G2-15 TaxID=1938850 RepID=UPI000BDDCF98|nr:response regulator transcription factor [Streptomyces sp. Ag109_G2-15]SOD90740.1 two component transcriptional regulator, LuxR family [Streptomyces sp. Ag109_G2-15]
MTIRVLLADDQALLRATFRILIDTCAGMEVVAEATDGTEALALTRAHRPDVVLMDIRMPGPDGLAATAAICGDHDLSGTRVLILTSFEAEEGDEGGQDDEYVVQALRAGASGFLGKDATAEALLAGIRTVAAGEALLSPAAIRTLITRLRAAPGTDGRPPAPERLAALTAREREVTALVAQGRSNEEIAARLFVSPLTVRTHVHRARTKLAARDRAQLVALAYQSGLVAARPEATGR